MHNITLICTVHKDMGKCNSKELLKLIKKNKPDVIFEELSETTYRECYELGRETLESSAIKMYLEDNNVNHIPVVGTELSDAFTQKHEINKTHNGCNKLFARLLSLQYEYGFNYLNSKYVDQLFDVFTKLEQDIVEYSKDDVITNIYKKAYENFDIYENDIVENIYNYSALNTYDKALMFIGSAHRKSIIDKINRKNQKEELKLNWTFYNGDEYFS